MRHEAMRKDAIARLIRTRNGLAMPLPARMSDAEMDIARKLSFSAAQDEDEADDGQNEDDDETTRKVQTVIRIRPLASSIGDECFRVTSDTALVAQPPKTSQAYRSTGAATSFQFSRIFQPQTAQQAFFEATTKPVIDAAFDGKNGLVFAYGVTNSGKTYTITGSESQPGVLPRALKHVMAELQRRKDISDSTPVVKVTASYLEIYNENVYDLLATPLRKRRALRVQDCDGKIQVRGVIEKQIKTLQEGEEMLTTGRSNTQVAETNCNMDSSRSHCVFTLHFYTQNKSSGVTSLRSKVGGIDHVSLNGLSLMEVCYYM